MTPLHFPHMLLSLFYIFPSPFQIYHSPIQKQAESKSAIAFEGKNEFLFELHFTCVCLPQWSSTKLDLSLCRNASTALKLKVTVFFVLFSKQPDGALLSQDFPK